MRKWIIAAPCAVGLAAAGSAWGATPSNVPHAVVAKFGQTRVVAAARLHPGETVSCINQGHVLSVEAPASPAISNGTVWTQAGTTRFHLHVTAEKGGGFVVDCGLGGFHWASIAAGTRHPRRPADSVFIA